MALKTWDQYVKEASRKPLTLKLPGRESVTITMPTELAIAEYNAATRVGDGERQLKALLGEENGAKVLELGKIAPATTLTAVINDVLAEFGLNMGNSPASSS